eukprot:9807366-Lingulodinium_polyedra.AAC.1
MQQAGREVHSEIYFCEAWNQTSPDKAAATGDILYLGGDVALTNIRGPKRGRTGDQATMDADDPATERPR